MRRRLSILALCLVLGACASSEPPPYGYTQEEVAPGTYLLRFTGKPQESAQSVRASLLRRAALLTRQLGHAQFAVLEQRSETAYAQGVAPTVGAYVPIVRSKRRGRRGSGPHTTVDLNRPVVTSVVARVRPFSGTPPEAALAVYDVQVLVPSGDK